MKKRTTNSGSAMVMILIISTALAAMAIAGVGMSGSMGQIQSKQESNDQGKLYLNGAYSFAKSDLIARRIKVGETKTYTVGGRAVTVRAEDNDSQMHDTVKLVYSTSVKGKSIAASQVMSMPKPIVTSIWSYALYSNSAFTWTTGTSVTGSVYFRSSPVVQGSGWTITRDFKTSSMYNPTGIIRVGGGIVTGMTPLDYPTIDTNKYLAAATTILNGSQTFTGYTFSKKNAVVVINGDLILDSSQITGTGLIIVTGNVTVRGACREGTNSHLMIATPKNVTFQSTGSTPIQADGYYFAGGTLTVGGKMTLNGSIAGNTCSVGGQITATWNPWIMNDPENAMDLKAPGMWP